MPAGQSVDPTRVPLPSGDSQEVYWGDRLALRIWLACVLLLWSLGLINLLTGFGSR